MNFIDILASAPWLVWGSLVFFVDIGLKSMHQHAVYIPKLFAIPALLIILKYKDIFSTTFSLMCCILFLLFGSLLGVLVTRELLVTFNKMQWTVLVPGSYLTFAILSMFFGVKFLFSYLESINQANVQGYMLCDIAISSLFAGYFLGRAVYFSYKFYK